MRHRRIIMTTIGSRPRLPLRGTADKGARGSGYGMASSNRLRNMLLGNHRYSALEASIGSIAAACSAESRHATAPTRTQLQQDTVFVASLRFLVSKGAAKLAPIFKPRKY